MLSETPVMAPFLAPDTRPSRPTHGLRVDQGDHFLQRCLHPFLRDRPAAEQLETRAQPCSTGGWRKVVLTPAIQKAQGKSQRDGSPISKQQRRTSTSQRLLSKPSVPGLFDFRLLAFELASYRVAHLHSKNMSCTNYKLMSH